MEPLQLNPAAAGFLTDRKQIEAFAEKYWDVILERDEKEERFFERAFPEFRVRRFLSKELFVRVARWKSVRNTPRYESNTDDEIRIASAAAFEGQDDASCISALRELNGVALRTASAILHWMHPKRFPILDYRVLDALGEKRPKSYEDVRFYSHISEQILKLARHHDLDLRTIDRALWTWDKQESKKRCT
jgi:hypothetical protein